MKTYPTFMNGAYVGKCTLEEIKKWEGEAREIAIELMQKEKPDHIIYAYYSHDNSGEIDTAYLQILIKDETEFKRISKLPNYSICALHKR